MRKILLVICISLASPTIVLASTLGTNQGGTGSTSPSGILFGNNNATPLSTLTVGSGLTLTGSTLSSTGGSSSFPFTPTTNYNSTSTPIGFLNGLFSTASSTFNGNLYLTNLSQGLLINGTNGLTSSVSTSTLSASSPLTGSFTQIGSGGSVGCQTASGSQAGCLSSTDWNTFNNKGSGSVTSITTSNGIQGGTITTTGNLSLISYLATSSAETAGQLAAWGTTSGTPAKLYSIATSTPTIGSVLTYSGTLGSFVGGTSGTFGIANSAITNAMLANSSLAITSPNSTLTLTSCNTVALGGTCQADINLATSNQWTASTTFTKVVNMQNASTTLLTVQGTEWITPLGTPAGAFLAVDPNGMIISTTSPSGGAVSSVSNSDGTLTISPTTGAVVASLALGHANTWTTVQKFNYGSSNTFTTFDDTSANGPALEFDISGSAKTYFATSNGNSSWITGSVAGDTVLRNNGKNILFSTDSGVTAILYLANGNKVGIGTTSPYAALSVVGSTGIVADHYTATSTTATSTLADGLNLTGGCLAYSGVCLTAGVIGGGSTQAVNWATTGALPSNTYSNGASGVGATITEIANGALSVDGNSPAVGDRILVKNEGTASHNGIYTVTATGGSLAVFVLTRSLDYDQTLDITPGITTYVLSGTANTDTTWAVSFTAPLTIGTGSLTYSQAAGSAGTVTSVALSGGTTGLTVSGSPITTSGTITLAGTLNIANGGTNETSFANSTNGLTYNGTGIISAPWTSPVDYPFASSTSITATSSLYANDTQNSWIAKVSPTHSLVLQTGTTTGWTATSSGPYIPTVVASFSGIIKQARCYTDTSFVSFVIEVNGSAASPTYEVASSTVGLVPYTSGNTFNAGDRISMINGTTTTAGTNLVTCTLDTTQS